MVTTEPRQEANEIVRGVASFDWPSGAEWDHHFELVVDALAAAIRVDEEHSADPNLCCLAGTPCVHTRLAWALSALREDETWHAS